MVPYFLYLGTALVLASQLCWLGSLGYLLQNKNPMTVYLALAGVLGITVSSFVALYRPRIAAILALFASCGVWLIYGPAALDNLFLLLHGQVKTWYLMPIFWADFPPIPFLPELLLWLTSCHAFIACFLNATEAPTTYFPQGPRPPSWRKLFIGLGILSLVWLAGTYYYLTTIIFSILKGLHN